MGAHQKPLLVLIVWRGAEATPTLKYRGECVYYIGKTLELMGIACLGAGLYLGCLNPYDYSESKAMGVEMGFLTLGVLVFFVGRLIEKRS